MCARLFNAGYDYAPETSQARFTYDTEDAFHHREIAIVLNCSDLTIAEIFTNDEQLARQLELQGCRRDIVFFEQSSLRAQLGQRLPHLFVLPKQSIVLEGLTAIDQGYHELHWRQLSALAVQRKLAGVRRDIERQELAERAVYERTRVAGLSPERKAELTAQRSAQRKQRTPEQREAAKERSRRYMANRSPEKKAAQTEQKRLNEIRRRAKLNEQEVSPCA